MEKIKIEKNEEVNQSDIAKASAKDKVEGENFSEKEKKAQLMKGIFTDMEKALNDLMGQKGVKGFLNKLNTKEIEDSINASKVMLRKYNEYSNMNLTKLINQYGHLIDMKEIVNRNYSENLGTSYEGSEREKEDKENDKSGFRFNS